ncbi:MAG: Pr6Pr family membrane protein [Candidatus Zixiibacteriota bacterium]
MPAPALYMRTLATIGVCLIWLSLAVRLLFDIQWALGQGAGVAYGVIKFLAAFTTCANIFIASIITASLTRSGSGIARVLCRPSVMARAAVYIIVMAVVFALFLANKAVSNGLNRVVGAFLHGVNPIVYLAFWFFLGSRAVMRYSHIFIWPIPALVYFAVILTRGRLTGSYPYPFIDPGMVGWAQVWVNSAVVLGLFFVVGAFVTAVRGRETRAALHNPT